MSSMVSSVSKVAKYMKQVLELVLPYKYGACSRNKLLDVESMVELMVAGCIVGTGCPPRQTIMVDSHEVEFIYDVYAIGNFVARDTLCPFS